MHVVGGEVGLSNLQRQIIHSTEDVGKAKDESARETLNRLNPHVDIRTYPTFVSASNIMDLIAEYDFIIDGTDNFAAKLLINHACQLSSDLESNPIYVYLFKSIDRRKDA